LLVVPVAMIALRERPGAVIVGASLAGFVGVALMLAPAFEGPALDSNTLIGVAAGLAMAVTTAAAKVQIKTLTATEPPGTIAFYFAVVCTITGLATFPFGWASPTGTSLVFMICAGITGGLAHIAMTEALVRAPASTLAPFEYTAMLWALAFDMVVFGLLPAPTGLVGALVIVAAAAVAAFAGNDYGPTICIGRSQSRPEWNVAVVTEGEHSHDRDTDVRLEKAAADGSGKCGQNRGSSRQ
jgi:drug/metabolite transporter (DMT)-like permease